jgi:hypothetical protein
VIVDEGAVADLLDSEHRVDSATASSDAISGSMAVSKLEAINGVIGAVPLQSKHVIGIVSASPKHSNVSVQNRPAKELNARAERQFRTVETTV